jgi:hypothetical protein
MRKKLERYRFSLDRRTGAIVADEVESGDQYAMGAVRDTYRDEEGEDSKTGLSRVGSNVPLLSDGGGKENFTSRASSASPTRSRELLDLPYEVEPLVLPHSRSPSRSPHGSRSPSTK